MGPLSCSVSTLCLNSQQDSAAVSGPAPGSLQATPPGTVTSSSSSPVDSGISSVSSRTGGDGDDEDDRQTSHSAAACQEMICYCLFIIITFKFILMTLSPLQRTIRTPLAPLVSRRRLRPRPLWSRTPPPFRLSPPLLPWFRKPLDPSLLLPL